MLPNSERAFVAPSKVRDYLLSPVHPAGRFKATVFAALGYTRENRETLRDDLVAIARSGTAFPAPPSQFGQKFESVVFSLGLLVEAANSQRYGWCGLAKSFPAS